MATEMNNIIILSNQKIRSSIIEKQIEESFKGRLDVAVVNPGVSLPFSSSLENSIIILDLMGIDLPAKQMIRSIRDFHPQIRIIALHMYRSSILVNPLFDLGVMGYIFYEPTKSELTDAIVTVSNGDCYKPIFLSCK